MTPKRVLTGARLLDPQAGKLLPNTSVLIEGGTITGVATGHEVPSDAEEIALAGDVLMPGMIDCHMHVVAETLDLWSNMIAPTSLSALRSARVMEETLGRGFTTIRDLGGADIGLVRGVEEGLIDGPRLIICGKGLSTTGGHCDLRARTDDRPGIMSERLGSMGILVDGTDDVRRVCRRMIKEGAGFIKLMANGGVSSPNDPIHALQFSREEISAAVEEAGNAGLYVSAHVYTDRAIRRCVDLGVHSLEHCNLIEPETAALAAERGCVAVPTLVAYEALAIEGEALGLGAESIAKIDDVRSGGRRSLSVMREAGLDMAFGSDLLGQLRKYHCMEIDLLAEVLSPVEIIRSLTSIGARLCGLEGRVGTIAPGASADLLVLADNPLDDITRLGDDGANFRAVMARGRFFKNELGTAAAVMKLGADVAEVTAGIDILYRKSLEKSGFLNREGLIPVAVAEVTPRLFTSWDAVQDSLAALRARIPDETDSEVRRGWLTEMVESLVSLSRMFAGETVSFAERLRQQLRLDFTVIADDVLDSYRAALREALDELGYSDGDLAADVAAWEADTTVPADDVLDVLATLQRDARGRSAKLIFADHDGDWLAPKGVRDQPFNAYCDYPGRSVWLNLDYRYTRWDLKHLAAHEAFPGHLVHLARREALVAGNWMPLEGAQVVTCSASSALFEGIADNGIALLDWIEGPQDCAGLVLQRLRSALRCNASWLIHGEDMSIAAAAEATAADAFQDVETTRRRLDMVAHPLRAPFLYAYWGGEEAVRLFLERTKDWDRRDVVRELYDRMHTPTTLLAAAEG